MNQPSSKGKGNSDVWEWEVEVASSNRNCNKLVVQRRTSAQDTNENDFNFNFAAASNKEISPRYVDHSYQDYSAYVKNGGKLQKHKKSERNFPARLHAMLSDERYPHIISWMVSCFSVRIVSTWRICRHDLSPTNRLSSIPPMIMITTLLCFHIISAAWSCVEGAQQEASSWRGHSEILRSIQIRILHQTAKWMGIQEVASHGWRYAAHTILLPIFSPFQ